MCFCQFLLNITINFIFYFSSVLVKFISISNFSASNETFLLAAKVTILV
ncbi:hypothetical protein cypCar_00035018 [Cyprinus carpio]|nr:hypothetical protein cypCar_00035018 [Cyprinus carpio]